MRIASYLKSDRCDGVCCAAPRGNNGCYGYRVEPKPLKRRGGPVTRPASVGIHERAERPRRSVPDISGTDEALPRDISLSGEHEARPAPLFASLRLLTSPRGTCILTEFPPSAQAQGGIISAGCGPGMPGNRKTLIYLRILATTPAPTVRPPSRIAKRRPSSIATGLISCTVIFTLSPGITISVPSGSVTAPVMSVVRK